MSAPDSAYDIKVLSDLTSSKDYKWAKLLSEYGGWSGIKEKFYLDEVLEGNEGGTTYFIGACNPSGTNASFHNSSRFGDIFYELRLLLDAGLNTLGYCDIQVVLANTAPNKDADPNSHPPRINNTVVFAYFKSAYYNNSTCKIEMETENNPGAYSEIESFSLAQALDTSHKSSVISENYLTKSGNHKFRVKLTNSEGTFTTSSLKVDIKMAIFSFNYDDSFASDAASGSSVTRYSNTRTLLDAKNNGDQATQLFTDETSNPLVHTANGYYSLDGWWYQYGYDTLSDRYAILAKGQETAGGYPSGDPGNIIVDTSQIDYNGYDKDDQSTADTEVSSGNYDSGSIYKEVTTDYEQDPAVNIVIYYSDSDKTTYASEGYYSIGEMVLGVTRQIAVGPNGAEIYDNIL